ncbi:MAG TPA: FG-GAP-like repeat-containing protein [Terracidiphilus sp.]
MTFLCLVSASVLIALSSPTNSRRSLNRQAAAACFLLAALLFAGTAEATGQSRSANPRPATAKPVTATTLAVTSGGNTVSSVAAGSVITLTAKVQAGSATVMPGQVNFCDAAAKSCTDIHLLGSAQLTSAGIATLKLRPGIGSHSYKAVFAGTGTYASSASASSTLTATGTIPPLSTATYIAQTGNWGAYQLSASVTEVGNTAAPTGTVSFLDQNHSDAVLGAGTLGTASRGVLWSTVQSSAPNLAAVNFIPADLNGDGIPDLFVKDYFGTYDVLLGKGDGTFTAGASTFGPASQSDAFVLGDFNNDGIPDAAAIDSDYFTSKNSLTVFLGNGDGTFTTSPSSPDLGMSPNAIAAADINGDGNIDLAVSQINSSGAQQLVILFGNGDGTFTAASAPVATASPYINSIIPADIDGDGNIDLVLSGTSILMGKGDGTFTSVQGPAQGVWEPVVADINNDGHPDLVLASSTGTLTAWLGNGDGTFTAAPASPTATAHLGRTLAIGDFNHDGIPDVAYSLSADTAAGLAFGKGDGAFLQSPTTVAYGYDFEGNIVVADFNGDGWADVLTIDLGGRTVEDSLSLPTETAIASAIVALPLAGTHLAYASYPGDSHYTSSQSDALSLWGVPPATATALKLTSGGTTLSSVTPGTKITLTASVTAGASPFTAGQVNFCDASGVSCADIHLLGTASLDSAGHAAFSFVPGPGTHSYKAMLVASGNGTTSSSPAVPLTVGPAPAPVYTDTVNIALGGSVGDYSLTATVFGFGGPAAPTGTISFVDTSFSNTSLGTAELGKSVAGTGWRQLQTPTSSAYPIAQAPGDFNGDGLPDVAVLWRTSFSHSGPYSITVYLGKGDGTFTTGNTIALTITGEAEPSMLSGDFNADGKLDLAVLSQKYGGQNTNYVTTLFGSGDGNFSAEQTSKGLDVQDKGGDVITGTIVAADFNGDGKLDIAVAGACVAPSCGAAILLGNGDGTFTATGTIYGSDQNWTQMVTGDFNGDGIPDLMAVNFFAPAGVGVLLGKGDGSFTMKQQPGLAVDNFATGMLAGDFNQDGKIDVAIGHNGGVEILLGNGDGTFRQAPGSPITGTTAGTSLVAGDFNHDGKTDLAGIDTYGDAILLLTGAGDGTFTANSTVPGGSDLLAPIGIVAADFNSDGLPDLSVLIQGKQYTVTMLTEPVQIATATLTGVAPVGAGSHAVKAKYPGDAHYPAGESSTVNLDAALKPLTITPAGGTFSTVQNVTITEPIPGATIYYQAYGMFNTYGFVKYTGPISLNIGGPESITAYATETGYYDSAYTSVAFTLNLPVAPAPVFSPAGGTFAASQTVTLSESTGATIYYTADGTPPNSFSPVYTTPITVSSSQAIAAIAAGGGYSPSPVVTAQFFIQSAKSRFIYTVAGSGTWGFSGDGGPATLAALNDPAHTAIDAAGNLYIADTGNQVVRKVDSATGVISTIAGTGAGGYSGDNGPATRAQLSSPYSLAFDSPGNLYIGDIGNGVIRRVDAKTGIITTYAGHTPAGALGDGGPATSATLTNPRGIAIDHAGNLYIADEDRVRMVNAATGVITTVAGGGIWGTPGDGGPATSAWLLWAQGVTLDGSGNLYIADSSNNVIRKVTASTGIISTVAGISGSSNGGYSGDGGPASSARLSTPSDVAVDAAGNLYIADSSNYVLREVTAADGIINTIAGVHSRCSSTIGGDGGTAPQSGLCNPTGVALDAQGNLYIAEEGAGRIRMITAPMVPPSKTTAQPELTLAAGTYATSQMLTLTDTTPAASIFVNFNSNSLRPSGQGYSSPIGVTGSAAIQTMAVAPGYLPSAPVSAKYTITTPPPSVIHTVAGNGGLQTSGIGGPATSASIGYPIGVAVDSAGNLYIVDRYNVVVWMVSAATGKLSVAAGIPGVAGMASPVGPAATTALGYPEQVAVDKADNLYISDARFGAVLKVDAKTGNMSVFAGGGQYSQTRGDGGPANQAYLEPYGLAFDAAGDLYIIDTPRVRKVSASTGIITTVAGGGTDLLSDGIPATSAWLGYLQAIAVDSKGNLYIGDMSAGRVRLVDANTGTITTIAGNGNPGATGDGASATAAEVDPVGLALDSSNDLYIANYPGEIRMVPAGGGKISRATGLGFCAFGGDSGAATMALLCSPQGLTFDKAGSLYIADYGNYRVRKVTYPGPTAAPTFTPAAGTYTGPQTVTITDATTGAAIYYTTDGSTPTTASTLYSAPISVSTSETLKAIALATGDTVSAVASANYVIKEKAVPAISWAAPAPIPYGTPLGATQLNASTTVAGSFAYTPAAGTILDPGQQTLSVTFTPTDTAAYQSATATVYLTVSKATPLLGALQSNLNPALAGDAVTLLVTVTSSAGSPSGTVAFMEGTSQLGSGTVSAGTASYTTSKLATGSHSIIAVYSGDGKFVSATTPALDQLIESFSIATSGGSSSTATVAPGGTAKYDLTVTPPAAGAPLTFSVTGLPAGATGVFSPSSVPVGGGAITVTLMVTAPASASAQPLKHPFSRATWTVALGLMLLPFAGRLRRTSRRWLTMVLLIAAGLTAGLGLSACGGSSGSSTPPPSSKTYALTVTATSGSLSQSTKLTLTIQ